MYEPYNYNNIYNPYTNPYLNYNQQSQQQTPISRQNQYRPQNSLQGKVVDSLDVVKATDIPYDGSVSYFPLTDGTAIITKQLQQDGTSKVVIYKPMIENEENKNKYITENDLEKQLKNMDSKFITGEDSMKALEDTMRLFTDFAQKMIRETESPEAKQIIKKHLRKISQMSEA